MELCATDGTSQRDTRPGGERAIAPPARHRRSTACASERLLMAAAPAISDPTEPGSEPSRRAGSSGRAAALAQRLGLHYVSADLLCIGRRANGKGWIFVDKRGRRVRDARVISRLRRLAVPPAY